VRAAVADVAAARVVRRLLAGAAVGAALWAGGAAVPGLAVAQTPAECPAAPAEYTGTDEVVAELRAQRAELAESCAATIERLDAVVGKLAGRLDVALPAGPLAVSLPTDPLPVSLPAGPVDVNVTNPGESTDVAPVVEAVEQSGADGRSALWFLAGLGCAGLFVMVVRRVFEP
jgi:hypothetical protein